MSVSEEELAGRALQRLHTASEAIIRGQYAPPDPSLGVQMNNQIIDQFGVQLWASPVVGNGGLPILYFLKARGIYFDVKHLLSFQRGDQVLEYWVTLISGTDWAGVAPDVSFRLVRMMDRDTPREIIHHSNRFSQTIPVHAAAPVEIPVDDARLIYELSPAAFAEAYAGSVLEGRQAYIDDTGEYRIGAP